MATYHIGKDGKPSICHATKKCPLGGADNHFSSLTDAIKESEKRFSEEAPSQGHLDKLGQSLTAMVNDADVAGPKREGDEYSINDPIGNAIDSGMTLTSSQANVYSDSRPSNGFVYESKYSASNGNIEIDIALKDSKESNEEARSALLSKDMFDASSRPSDAEAQNMANILNFENSDMSTNPLDDDDIISGLEESKRNIIENIARAKYGIDESYDVPAAKLAKIDKHVNFDAHFETGDIFEAEDIQNAWDDFF
jgi:hypothetical protein